MIEKGVVLVIKWNADHANRYSDVRKPPLARIQVIEVSVDSVIFEGYTLQIHANLILQLAQTCWHSNSVVLHR